MAKGKRSERSKGPKNSKKSDFELLCPKCGNPPHLSSSECPARGYQCGICQLSNHFEQLCRNKKPVVPVTHQMKPEELKEKSSQDPKEETPAPSVANFDLKLGDPVAVRDPKTKQWTLRGVVVGYRDETCYEIKRPDGVETFQHHHFVRAASTVDDLGNVIAKRKPDFLLNTGEQVRIRSGDVWTQSGEVTGFDGSCYEIQLPSGQRIRVFHLFVAAAFGFDDVGNFCAKVNCEPRGLLQVGEQVVARVGAKWELEGQVVDHLGHRYKIATLDGEEKWILHHFVRAISGFDDFDQYYRVVDLNENLGLRIGERVRVREEDKWLWEGEVAAHGENGYKIQWLDGRCMWAHRRNVRAAREFDHQGRYFQVVDLNEELELKVGDKVDIKDAGTKKWIDGGEVENLGKSHYKVKRRNGRTMWIYYPFVRAARLVDEEVERYENENLKMKIGEAVVVRDAETKTWTLRGVVVNHGQYRYQVQWPEGHKTWEHPNHVQAAAAVAVSKAAPEAVELKVNPNLKIMIGEQVMARDRTTRNWVAATVCQHGDKRYRIRWSNGAESWEHPDNVKPADK